MFLSGLHFSLFAPLKGKWVTCSMNPTSMTVYCSILFLCSLGDLCKYDFCSSPAWLVAFSQRYSIISFFFPIPLLVLHWSVGTRCAWSLSIFYCNGNLVPIALRRHNSIMQMIPDSKLDWCPDHSVIPLSASTRHDSRANAIKQLQDSNIEICPYLIHVQCIQTVKPRNGISTKIDRGY